MEYKRLTTDKPDGNFETLMNYCYGKDRVAILRYAWGTTDIPLHEYVAKLCKEKGCIEDDNLSLQEIEERIFDPMDECCNCPVGVLYYLGCQAVNTRGVLKRYEDSGLSPNEVQELAKAKAEGRVIILPNIKKNKTIYWIWGNVVMPCRFMHIRAFSGNGKVEIALEVRTKKDWQGGTKRHPYTYKAGDKRYLPVSKIGKAVFLTKEEAEKALESDAPRNSL